MAVVLHCLRAGSTIVELFTPVASITCSPLLTLRIIAGDSLRDVIREHTR